MLYTLRNNSTFRKQSSPDRLQEKVANVRARALSLFMTVATHASARDCIAGFGAQHLHISFTECD